MFRISRLFLQTRFLVLASIIIVLFASCKSPASPSGPPPTRPKLPFGFYDDFESGVLDDSKWSTLDPKWVNIKDDGTGNHICEIIDTHITMISPDTIFPDEFDRLSARIRIPSQARFLEYGSALHYQVAIQDRPRTWWTELGIRRDSASSAHFFANWQDLSSGRKWDVAFGGAQLDVWYRLELQIVQIDPTQLKILYLVDGRDLAETIPEDSPVLLDHTKLYNTRRFLMTVREAGSVYENAIGWFDDVWGVSGPSVHELSSSPMNQPTGPFMFIAPPDKSQAPQPLLRRGAPISPDPSKRPDQRKLSEFDHSRINVFFVRDLVHRLND